MAYPHEVDDAGVVVRKNVDADNQAGDPTEVQAVTGRANDLKSSKQEPALANSTFASRGKAVSPSQAENKAVGGLDSMTKAELQAYASDHNIGGVDQDSQTKAEMIETIRKG